MNKYVKRYCIDAMSGMAQGLFASLLIGTIIKTLGQQLCRLSNNAVFQFLVNAGNFASDAHVVGAAMAVGIGFAMGLPALVLLALPQLVQLQTLQVEQADLLQFFSSLSFLLKLVVL